MSRTVPTWRTAPVFTGWIGPTVTVTVPTVLVVVIGTPSGPLVTVEGGLAETVYWKVSVPVKPAFGV